MKADTTSGGSQVEPSFTPISTASMSGGCAAVRASTLLRKRLSVLAASCASRNFSRTLPVRYLSRISQSSVPGLRKISPCPCNSCRTVSAGFPRSCSIRAKSTLPLSLRAISSASLGLSAVCAVSAGLRTRCRKMAAFRAEAGLAALPVLRAISGEMPLSYSISRDSSRACSGSSRIRLLFVWELRWPYFLTKVSYCVLSLCRSEAMRPSSPLPFSSLSSSRTLSLI